MRAPVSSAPNSRGREIANWISAAASGGLGLHGLRPLLGPVLVELGVSFSAAFGGPAHARRGAPRKPVRSKVHRARRAKEEHLSPGPADDVADEDQHGRQRSK